MGYHTHTMKASPAPQPLPKTISQEYLLRVSRKGMVTLPKMVRQKLKAETKGQVVVRVEENQITLGELPLSLEEAYGSVTPINRPEDFKKLRKIALDEKAERFLAKKS